MNNYNARAMRQGYYISKVKRWLALGRFGRFCGEETLVFVAILTESLEE